MPSTVNFIQEGFHRTNAIIIIIIEANVLTKHVAILFSATVLVLSHPASRNSSGMSSGDCSPIATIMLMLSKLCCASMIFCQLMSVCFVASARLRHVQPRSTISARPATSMASLMMISEVWKGVLEDTRLSFWAQNLLHQHE